MKAFVRLTINLIACLAMAAMVMVTPVAGSPALEPAAVADAPQLISPADGAQTTGNSAPPVGVPTLEWASVTAATRYHVQLSASVGFAELLVDTDTYALAYSPATALADGTYYWRVKALAGTAWGAYSEIWSFNKDWSAGGTIVPGLISPPEGAERASFTVDDFSWTPVVGAAYYLFEISPDDTFSTITYTANSIRPIHTPLNRLANNTYYWRVTPVDRRGNRGTASDAARFQFNWNLAPAPLAPANDVDVQFLPRFSWTAVEGARDYRLEISTQEDFSTSLTAYTTDQTDYTPEKNLSNDQDYYWRVRATDHASNNGPWSAVRHLRMRWNFDARLLTPLNNMTAISYPFFTWAPIPGAQQYQIQIDESTGFDSTIADEKIYNAPAHTQPRWATVLEDTDYFWRVRGLDGQGNLTPWSDLRSFRPLNTSRPSIRPSQIYPPYYYPPDTVNTPVHSDRTIAWPLFMWDSAHVYNFTDGGPTLPPDYYELSVDDDPAFGSPNFQVQTAGLAAAPTALNPFAGLQDGQIYYWRVRAWQGGSQIGVDSVWVTRYDRGVPQLPAAEAITLIHPAGGFEAVGTPPVLGWLPVTGAASYEVQISRDPAFTQVVDQAETATVNFVPWQGRLAEMPFDTYWWRVRTKQPEGAWSEARRFNLSKDLLAGNPYDFVPPAKPGSLLGTATGYDPALTFVDTGAGAAGAYGLGALHAIVDRTYSSNYAWAIAFDTSASSADALRYGLYFDIDHVEGSGAGSDPLGKPVSVDPLYLPEYAIYLSREAGNILNPANAFYYHWNGTAWDPAQALDAIGGDAWLDPATNAVQVLVPYTAIGSEDTQFSGSLALTVFSTANEAADGMRGSVPVQGATLNHPALISDMLMPLYPFDTPLSDPIIFYDMPAARWRMPYFDSVDGYQVQVARDARFTDLVETWESFESVTSPYYALVPAGFQSKNAYEDNVSYYWRVRIRHERYLSSASYYDYGPWSPAMRFRLDSRRVTNTQPPAGTLATMTPTFTWDRVEGAAGYKLQLDNDSNFSSPLVNKNIDGTSFTPTTALADGTYYWRVAMRRSSTVTGHWTETMSFVKQSVSPAALSPAYDDNIAQQPTITWAAVLTPTVEPRLAAPRYRLQIADDPNFSSPRTITTAATSFTPAKTQSLADGAWYWRVAALDANGNPGLYGPAMRFYKEYDRPVLLAPSQGGTTTGIPTFEWAPLDGAAYYQIQYANNALFNSPTTITTDNASYTPTAKFAMANCYWRVRIYDADGNPGPWEQRAVQLGSWVYLPQVMR